MLKLDIVRLAARGLRDGPDRLLSSTIAGPAGVGGTSGVRARKRMVRETEPNMMRDGIQWK